MKTQLSIFKKRSFLFFVMICLLVNSVNAQNTVWALPFKPNSTANNVNVTDVEFDASGNIFTTGSFRGTVNFNFNGTATNATSAGGHDIFLAMYNSSGTIQWLKTIGGTADDAAVALDIQGTNVVIAGTFVSTSVDFDPGTGTNVLSSSGLTDIFVAKFDNNGNHVWAKRSGSTQGELVTDVEFDSNSNVFVAGSFTTLMDFFSNTNTSTNGARDVFLCKLDVNGAYVSVKVIGGAGTDVSNKISVFGSNSILICADIGYSASSTTFDPGSGTASLTFSGTSGTNGIVSDFNSSGAYNNTLHFKGNSHMIKMLAINNENIGIGTFSGTMDINPFGTVTNVTATGVSDMFMVNTGFPTGGSFIAYGVVNGIGSTDAIYPANAAMKVNTNYQTDLYITGYAKGAINFGGTSTADLQGSGTNDYSFEVKFNHDHFNSNDFELKYAYKNAFPAGTGSTEFSHGNGIALNAASGDVVLGGNYSSNIGSPNAVVFNPGNVSVSQTYSTASMGYVQYLSGCAIPSTLAVSNDYSICAGQTVTLTVSGATTYSWNTGSTATSFTVAPTTTTTYTVNGTVAGGCAKTDTVKITVTALPSTLAVSNDYSLCIPQTATLTASGATTYSWNTGSTATSFTVAPTSTTTYTLTGTTNGCSKTDTVKITVTAGPNVVGISNLYSTCSGQTATLSASGATTYSWNTGSTATSFTVAPTATTTYSVTGTTGGCTKTDTVKITVKTAVVTSTNPDFNCGPGTVTLTAATGAGTLQWFAALTGGSPLGTGTSFTTPSISANTTYYVGVNNGGCLSTSRTSVLATIKTIPNTPTGTSAARCGTGTVTISATPGGLGSIFWYSSPTSTSPIGTNSSYTTPSISTTTTYYAATASGGCYSARVAVQAIVQSAAPTAGPTNTTPGANLTICSGNTTTLSASGVAMGTIKWWTASTGGTLLFTGATYTTPTLTTNTTYYAEDNNSCGAGPRTAVTVTVGASAVAPTNTTVNSTICSGSTAALSATASGTIKWWTASTGGTLLTTGATYTTPVLTSNTTYYAENVSTCGTSSRTAVAITVTALPNVVAVSNDYSTCAGQTATLTASGGAAYSWDGGSTAASYTVAPIVTTTYTVTGTTSGCSKTDTVKITVTPLPDNSVTVTDPTITAVETGATYQWINCPANTTIGGATSQSYTAIANGNYAVIVTKNGCADTSSCNTIATVGVKEHSDENSLVVYPNPASKYVTLSAKAGEEFTIDLVDFTGKTVYSVKLINNKMTLDISSYSNGLYFIRYMSNNKVNVQKLIITQ